MLSKFEHLIPEVIFESAELLGGRCTGRFLTLNAMENRVYDLAMEEGPNLIIKFYRPGRWSEETIRAEHQFLKACAENEVPAVCPIEDENGETLHNRDGIFYTLFPKRPGRLEPELNRDQLARLGTFLGRIHTVGAAMSGSPRITLSPQTYGRDSLKYLMDENLLQGNLAAIYKSLVDQICDLCDPLFEGTENILLHGDCHAGNVLWNDSAPYFIDFDDMLFAPPVQDFWMLIGGDDEYAKENRKVLIENYEVVRHFNPQTLRLIEPLRALRMVYFSTWIGRRREDGAFKLAFPHFGTERYWQEQIEHLSLQLERVKVVQGAPLEDL